MATIPVQTTTSNTHVSENFAKLLEPGLRKIFFETYKELPEYYSKVYNMNTSSKAKETDYGLGAFGDWVERGDELDTVAYAKLSPGLERTYVHKAFTKGFIIGRELYDDEQYNQMNKMSKALARAGRAKVEKDAMETFIYGFDGTGSAIYDGKALFATNHPLIDSSKTVDNLVTGALNDANLKIAIQCMQEQLDEAGNLIQMTPDTLIVPPSLEFVAKELIESAGKVGTNNNDINTLKGSLKLVVMPYLGAVAGGYDNAWFLQDSKRHELNFFWRVKPEFKSTEEFDNFTAKYRGYMRYSYGVSDFRGMVGSLGGDTAKTR